MLAACPAHCAELRCSGAERLTHLEIRAGHSEVSDDECDDALVELSEAAGLVDPGGEKDSQRHKLPAGPRKVNHQTFVKAWREKRMEVLGAHSAGTRPDKKGATLKPLQVERLSALS